MIHKFMSLLKLLAMAVLTVLYVCWNCVIKFPLILGVQHYPTSAYVLELVCESEEIYKVDKRT